MIFCFVRETKQLTLEELDRKHAFPGYVWYITDRFRRGLLGSNQEVHWPRTDRVAAMVDQALHLPPGHPQAATHHRYGRRGPGYYREISYKPSVEERRERRTRQGLC